MLADDCYRLEEMNNSSNVKIQMTAEQIFKEIEALPRTEWERLVAAHAGIGGHSTGFHRCVGRFQPGTVRVDGNRAE